MNHHYPYINTFVENPTPVYWAEEEIQNVLEQEEANNTKK